MTTVDRKEIRRQLGWGLQEHKSAAPTDRDARGEIWRVPAGFPLKGGDCTEGPVKSSPSFVVIVD